MKRIILFLAFILPVAIFIFLRYFGKNEFEIPVYFEADKVDIPEGCNKNMELPYSVSELQLNMFGWNGNDIIVVADTSIEVKNSINRVTEEFQEDNLDVLFLNLNDSSSIKFCSCDLLLKNPWTTVLIDKQRRIRGYYSLGSREELDRLSVELKILLKRY